MPMITKKISSVLIVFFMVVILFACNDKRSLILSGTWEVDSIYSFYNNFGFTQTDTQNEPRYTFVGNDTVRLTIGEESRNFLYVLPHPDTLIIKNPAGEYRSVFCIVGIDKDKLKLREEKRLLFPGNNQERYAIHFLSKVVDQ